MDEKQAIQQLKNGDIRGLEFLVASFQVKAVRTAYLITRDAGLAEDIVQDSFIQAYRAIHGFDISRAFEPWFMRSVVNASLKQMHRQARQVPLEDGSDESFMQLVERVESVESQI
jgi:RNA polymerase sigma-70 factor (ECF subfamily)